MVKHCLMFLLKLTLLTHEIPTLFVFQKDLAAIPLEKQTDAIRYVIHTRVGDDPQVLDDSETLLDSQGMPKYSIE